ncbi:MAG: hypothetical protein AAGG01_11775 [Planctomycetota bacterium]
MISRSRLSSLGLCGLLGLASCASYTTQRSPEILDKPADWEPLPYHVAVIPVAKGDVVRTDEGADRSGAGFAFQFQDVVRADGAADSVGDPITASLEQVLTANSFQEVTVLPRPTEAQYAVLGEEGLASYWVAAAREAKADLLLSVDAFSYPEKPRSSAELLSFALFLAGPVELFFPDREYKLDGVRLDASLYDLQGLDAPDFESIAKLMNHLDGGGELEATAKAQRASNIRDFQFEPVRGGAIQGTLRVFIVSPPDIKFRFGDRLGGGPGKLSFWSSVLIPSAWLQRDSDSFSERLTADTSLVLAQDLAREIVEGDFEYIVGSRRNRQGLVLDARTARLERMEGTNDVLKLTAKIRANDQELAYPEVRIMDRMYAISLDADQRSVGSQLAQNVRSAAADGEVFGTIQTLAGVEDGFAQELQLYLPAPKEMGLRPVSDQGISELVPLESIQLSLGEDLGSQGVRPKSWTFGLDSVYSDQELEQMIASPVAGSSSTIQSDFGSR